MSTFLALRTLAVATVIFALAGCGASLTPNSPGSASVTGASSQHVLPAFTKPALVTLDANGALAYWPISPGGGNHLKEISKPLGISAYGMAAHHDVVVMADFLDSQVVSYNLKTKTETKLPDPFGNPDDVAIGKTGTIYALNFASVAVYKPGSSQPSELTCPLVTEGESIAVDKQGDVFVDGYGQNFAGVIEYKAGKTKCITPDLNPVEGYIAGVGVDPKTDNLITIDDPDDCAGGLEGRMFIYPRPYHIKTAHEVDLYATYCSGGFRLNSTSTLLFVSDASVSDGYSIIDQFAYPSGNAEGTYQVEGSGGYFGPFTTIPNKLPN